MELQKYIAALAANIVSVDCAAHQSGQDAVSLFYLKKLVFAGVPFLAVMVPAALLLLWALLLWICRRPVSAESIKTSLITSAIVVLFFLHPTLTQQAFIMLSCQRLGVDDTDYFLVDDMQVCSFVCIP